MKVGNLVKYKDYDGYVSFGYVLYLDTDANNDVYYRIRWHDGSETDEYEDNDPDEFFEVIQ